MGATRKRKKTTYHNVVVEIDGDGMYVASVPELPGCHTQATSLDILMERIREAIELCLDDGKASTRTSNEFVGVQRISVGRG